MVWLTMTPLLEIVEQITICFKDILKNFIKMSVGELLVSGHYSHASISLNIVAGILRC